MQLSKKIPSRTKTVRFRWARKNFTQCTKRFIAIRGGPGKSLTYCDWCKHEFELGEWIAIAQPMPKQEGPKRNWALCDTCADLMGAPDMPEKTTEQA